MKISANKFGFKKALSGILVLAAMTIGINTQAQTPYKVISGSQIKVTGTSNMHDWDMKASTFTCEGTFSLNGGQLKDITALNFVLPIKNLKSKETLMDTRAYKALKEDQFDKITFKLLDAVVVPQQKIVKATGNLTIGGVTNKVAIQTTYTVNADESIIIKGTKAFKMSEFNIKAPSFMMGALKTGDQVTIDFLLKLKN